MKALVIAEHPEAARELAAGARTLADEVALVAFGEAPENAADAAYIVEVPEGAVADDAYLTIQSVYEKEQPAVVLAEPTRHVKSVLGRLAAAAGAAAITDVTAFEDGGALSLYFGGVGERVRKAAGDVAFYTVVPGTFADAEPAGSAVAETVAWIAPARPLRLVSSREREKGGTDLFKAEAVVACGRGFAEESELDLARALADKIDGGLACSRPLTEGVDWMPQSTYVGVSGLTLTPKVYVACGISGQMQHMVGCNRSGAVFAINKDKNAPVFKQCDYGLVGDIKDVLPALTAAL